MDELTALAGRMGVELPDDLLESVAGGMIFKKQNGEYMVTDDNFKGSFFVDAKTLEEAQNIARDLKVSAQVVDPSKSTRKTLCK